VLWCCEQGGDPVRRGLTAALKKAPRSVASPSVPDALAGALADHGWLGADVRKDAFSDTAAVVAARVDALAAG
jgi:hypothetical protein